MKTNVTAYGSTAEVHIDNLVLTVSHDTEGYEILVEIDRDEDAANVPVSISTAAEDGVRWQL